MTANIERLILEKMLEMSPSWPHKLIVSWQTYTSSFWQDGDCHLFIISLMASLPAIYKWTAASEMFINAARCSVNFILGRGSPAYLPTTCPMSAISAKKNSCFLRNAIPRCELIPVITYFLSFSSENSYRIKWWVWVLILYYCYFSWRGHVSAWLFNELW